MKAFMLAAGKASRLRPFSHGFCKSSLLFLNLPLFYYSWFYLEQLGFDKLLINTHLFPDLLKKQVSQIQKQDQDVTFSFEEQPLGASGSLVKNSQFFDEDFWYINGDSCFFPSSLESFEQLKTSSDNEMALFWTVPVRPNSSEICFWVDKKNQIQIIGTKEDVISKKYLPSIDFQSSRSLRSVQFTGLARMNKKFISHIQKKDFHLFSDSIIPILSKEKFKVVIDEQGLLLEAGDCDSYLKATNLCLDQIFFDKSFSQIFKKIFTRFDPKDEKVGLQRGKEMAKQLQALILAPKSVSGIEHLKVKDFAVVGAHSRFVDTSLLESAVLGTGLSWQGSLKKDMIFDFINSVNT